jgi:transcriptional regulator with XRE-family HTH domain
MRVEVTPGLLQWARERAGVDAATLTQRFPRLAEWESGDARPTLKQLEQFARATHAPLGFFFLAAPPVETIPIPDVRTVRDRAIIRPSPDLLAPSTSASRAWTQPRRGLMAYLLDSDVFIQAKNLHYGLDSVRPSGTGSLSAIERVSSQASRRLETSYWRGLMNSRIGRELATRHSF